ncbi:hypothetical protein ABT56_12840 [Photobacterium aquae]|uniref:Porin n=1 Tax=Photobacterium aquae TaxID=1195763 RepID=A0A0J1JS81_9GAMM|nr:hypothetical protein ABT56_12840 [Photobacterium aquae]
MALLLTLPSLCMATDTAEESPDPSDLTQVNSFAMTTLDTKGDGKFSAGIAGQYSEGNTFLGLAEYSKKNVSRLRYFQVLDTGIHEMDKAGFSIDYIKDWSATQTSDLIAIGGIAKVNTPWESFTIYPNVAYVTGKTGNMDINGYQANLFGSLSLSDWGQYMIVQPQWMETNIGSKLETKIGYGQPISDDGKWWVQVDYTNLSQKAKGSKSVSDNKGELGFFYYF